MGDKNPAKKPEVRLKISKALKGRTFSKEIKNKMSNNHADFSGDKNPNYGNHYTCSEENKLNKSKKSKEWWSNPENKDKIEIRNKKLSKKLKGRIITKETREKISKSKIGKTNKGNNILIKGLKFLDCENCGGLFFALIRKKFCCKDCHKSFMKKNNPVNSISVRNAISNTLKNKWKTDFEYVNQILYNRNKRPNKIELFLERLFKGNGILLEYVGGGSYWIGPCISGKRRNPDFINKSKKKILLFNGKHWHSEEEDNIQLQDYKNKGFDVFILNEDNLSNQENLLTQIRRWIKSDSTM